VTKAAKPAFLDSSRALTMLTRDPKADALETEWKKVQAEGPLARSPHSSW
jgi:hypothetical protein